MHIAYYILRKDGDGELFVALPVDDDFFSYPELSKQLQETIEQGLNRNSNWFKVGHTECDFPDIWDLSTSSSRNHILPD